MVPKQHITLIGDLRTRPTEIESLPCGIRWNSLCFISDPNHYVSAEYQLWRIRIPRKYWKELGYAPTR